MTDQPRATVTERDVKFVRGTLAYLIKALVLTWHGVTYTLEERQHAEKELAENIAIYRALCCAEAVREERERRERAEEERDEARAWVRKMHAESQTLTCVYCGHAYPPGTAASGEGVLTDHIKVCEKHPMRQAEQRVKELEEMAPGLAYLTRMINSSTHSLWHSHLRFEFGDEKADPMIKAIRSLTGEAARG